RVEKRRAKSAVAVFARESPRESTRQSDDLFKKAFNLFSPVRSAHVDQRIDVNVRVARVTEDDSPHSPRIERCPHATHIVGEASRRHRTILDELHRFEIWIERREDWTGRVAKLPNL